ncbi:MAG: helix-turn-helix domain-containing protein [Spirochaetia bacterium]
MSFSLDVHIKRRADYRRIERALSEGSGVRAIARHLEVSTGTVLNRLERAARSAFATLSELSTYLAHRESLAFDGFRSFCVCQHLPCDITHLIGRDSEYVYVFDYAPLRRGGRMNAAQRASQKRFERSMSPNPHATEDSAARIYDHILEAGRWPPEHPPKEIWSDEHYAYIRAWQAHSHITHAQHLRWVIHRTISAKAPRTGQNPIRAVNYFDRELRKDLAEHHRETVCFARTPHGMLARFAVYVAHHNMDKPKRISGSRSPWASERTATSHAVAAGAPAEVAARLQLTRLTSRPFLSRAYLGAFASLWWRGQIPTPPDRRMPHIQAYALA